MLRPLALAMVATAAMTAHADTLSLTIGAYYWQPDIEGDVQSSGTLVNLQSDLGFDDDSTQAVYLQLEHPIPILPNLLVQYTPLDLTQSSTLSRSIVFDGDLYPASSDVKTSLDLSHADATFYYEVLDNMVSLDLGLTLRYFPESVSIQSRSLGQSSSFDFDALVPMVYGAARVALPLKLSVGGDVNWLGAGDSRLMDYRVNVDWNPLLGLRAELGWRNLTLDYEDGDDVADLTLKGAYAGVSYRF